ncbi:MAG: A/G-specific adenine glycosylase [Anaerolineaceae bacterium]|nr:A/G-specific adenine glycosylase [Anaerolineaceae bacterium]
MAWYAVNARDLPWRKNHDPFLIWVSEVMLQQTQVKTVIPYFERWVKSFPTVYDLAKASEESVLRVWEGLGYYSRARNIKKSADIIVNDFHGCIPREVNALKKLPGIGEYIAAAIASIAFGLNVPALEANGERIVSRLFDFHGRVDNLKNKKILNEYLYSLLPSDMAGDFNQAVMDFGSSICLLVDPKCGICPLQEECQAFRNNTQQELPKKKSRPPKPHYKVVAAIIEKNREVLIAKRKSAGLLGGLWEFPGGKIEPGESHEEALIRELYEELGIEGHLLGGFGLYKHTYTHFSIEVYPYFMEIMRGMPNAIVAQKITWASITKLGNYPMGKVDRDISNALLRKIEN